MRREHPLHRGPGRPALTARVPSSTDCQSTHLGPGWVRKGPRTQGKSRCRHEKLALGAPGNGTPPGGLDRRPTNVSGMSGEVAAAQPAVEPPQMLLVFARAATDAPIRPIEVAAVLNSIEEIFLVCLLRDAPPPDHRG